MDISIFTLISCWLTSIAALTFSPDFDSTVPSILGLTNFSYPTTHGTNSPSPRSNLQLGYADGVVNTDFHQPWPHKSMRAYLEKRQPFRDTWYIRYCFADQASKDALWCPLAAAANLWIEAMGGKPSPQTGYDMNFVPTWAAGEVQFCYKEGTWDAKKGTRVWNSKLAGMQDALVVSYWTVNEQEKQLATAATVGYTPVEMLMGGGESGRHWMQISDKNDKVRIAHELGHVFGLLHEHQRNDRDIFIDYRPENIRGYSEALAAAKKLDKLSDLDAIVKLRNNYSLCQKHNFRGSAYVKNADQPPPVQGDPSEGPMDFDFSSIMMYPSDACTAVGNACRDDLTKYPIVRKVGMDK